MAFCYIIFSVSLNRFYIGSTILDPKDRLQKHLEQFYGTRKFTAKTKDGELYLEIPCESIDVARKIEKHIKRMKSKKYIRSLKQYPAIIDKLRQRYTDTS